MLVVYTLSLKIISRAIKIFLAFPTISVFIVDSRQLYKFYTCNMAITLSKPPRSSWFNFFHDLVTVDFHQTDIYTGVRLATLLIIVTVLGLLTGHAAASSSVWLGAAYVLAVDQLRSNGPRTRFLLTVSILYASIFAIGMGISISGNLVVPLCGLGLFIIAYFTIYPKAFWALYFASLMFVIAIATQGATLALSWPELLATFCRWTVGYSRGHHLSGP